MDTFYDDNGVKWSFFPSWFAENPIEYDENDYFVEKIVVSHICFGYVYNEKKIVVDLNWESKKGNLFSEFHNKPWKKSLTLNVFRWSMEKKNNFFLSLNEN